MGEKPSLRQVEHRQGGMGPAFPAVAGLSHVGNHFWFCTAASGNLAAEREAGSSAWGRALNLRPWELRKEPALECTAQFVF